MKEASEILPPKKKMFERRDRSPTVFSLFPAHDAAVLTPSESQIPSGQNPYNMQDNPVNQVLCKLLGR
jgi:hypothetical protein